MKTFKLTFAAALASCLALVGCGQNWKAEIESNTSWNIMYGGVSGGEFVFSELNGTGNKTIDLPDDDRVCCLLTQRGSGAVHLKIKDDGGNPFHLFAADEREARTNVSGGTIEMCSEGTIPK